MQGRKLMSKWRVPGLNVLVTLGFCAIAAPALAAGAGGVSADDPGTTGTVSASAGEARAQRQQPARGQESVQAQAQAQAHAHVQARQATLPLATERQLPSRHTGQTYRIQTTTTGEPPAGGYPVLYVLDGDAMFPVVAMAAHSLSLNAQEHGVGPMLIVGVGYGDDAILNRKARALDYTPPAPGQPDSVKTGGSAEAHGGRTDGHRGRREMHHEHKGKHEGDGGLRHAGGPQGGADRFLRFLTQELRPAIAQEFPVNTRQQSLYGHSYGGLFALYTLFRQPDAFQNYLASSPSVWWNKGQIRQLADAFVQQYGTTGTTPLTRLHITLGEYERTPSPKLDPNARRARMQQERARAWPASGVYRLLKDRIPGLAVTFAEYPAATHAESALFSALDAPAFVGDAGAPARAAGRGR